MVAKHEIQELAYLFYSHVRWEDLTPVEQARFNEYVAERFPGRDVRW